MTVRLSCHTVFLTLLVAVAMPVAATAQQPLLRPGDIVVVNDVAGPSGPLGPEALVKIDPSTGATILSDFSDPSQGPVYVPAFPPRPPGPIASLAIGGETAIFVVVPFSGTDGSDALVRVHPATGMRAIISDFGDASQGPVLETGGLQLAIEPSGDVLGVYRQGGVLIRVNRSTGTRTIVSDFQDPSQGPVMNPSRAAVEESGQILVSSGFEGAGSYPRVVRVDPSNGVRALLSDFGNPAQGASSGIADLTVDPSGNILVIGSPIPALPVQTGRLLRIDPATGARTLVSDQTCIDDAPPVVAAWDLAIEETGDVLVVVGRNDPFIGITLRRVNSVTGECAGGAGGGLFVGDVAVVPTPLVNELVSLSVDSHSFEPPSDDPFAPAGMFRIIATFVNDATIPIRNPFFRVAELTAGNMLVSGDRPPDLIRTGGKGTRQTPDAGADGVLSPGESVTVEFGIGLQTRQSFTFLVNVFGEPEASESAQ